MRTTGEEPRIDDPRLLETADSLPIVHTFAEVEARGWDCPGLARLEGRWLRLALYLQENAARPTAEGTMIRAVESLLLGLVEGESCLMMMGLTDATMAASSLTRSAEEVLEEVIAEEARRAVERPVRPELRVLPGGREDAERR